MNLKSKSNLTSSIYYLDVKKLIENSIKIKRIRSLFAICLLVFIGSLIINASDALAYFSGVQLESGDRSYHKKYETINGYCTNPLDCSLGGLLQNCPYSFFEYIFYKFDRVSDIYDTWTFNQPDFPERCSSRIDSLDYKVYRVDVWDNGIPSVCDTCSYSTITGGGQQCYSEQGRLRLYLYAGTVIREMFTECSQQCNDVLAGCGVQSDGLIINETNEGDSAYTFKLTCEEGKIASFLEVKSGATIESKVPPTGEEFLMNGVPPKDITTFNSQYLAVYKTYEWKGTLAWDVPVNKNCGDSATITPSMKDAYGYGEIGDVIVFFDACEDKDGDGHFKKIATCQQGDDCNDADKTVYPGATEICNNKDNNCNGEVDEGLYEDKDGDGHYSFLSCLEPKDDCNDNDPVIYTGALEICDEKDNNCDGLIDNDCIDENCEDKDGDGHFAISETCEEGDDCDDNNYYNFPSNEEVCGYGDNNCDGNVDEGLCCGFSFKVDRTKLWPVSTEGEKSTDVVVGLTKVRTDGCKVSVYVTPYSYSGAHIHDSSERPSGFVIQEEFLFSSPGAQQTKYYTSFVSGREKITAELGDEEEFFEQDVFIRVPELYDMGGMNYYRLTGQTTKHPFNHYAKLKTLINTSLIAEDYYDLTDSTLGINDMSLESGGLFDISGQWITPHITHRKGTSVDIDRRVYYEPTHEYILINCQDDDVLLEAVEGKNRGNLICESGGRKHIEIQ